MSLRQFHLALIATLLASTVARGQATVTGKVMDSVSHRPLAGAMIQMAADSSRPVKMATTDSLGAYRIDDVAAGTYIIGFNNCGSVVLWVGILPR